MQYALKNRLALIAGSLAALAAPAYAALPTEVDTMFTSVAADAVSAMGKGWILFAVIVGGLVLFKLVKKVLGKAT